MNKMINWEMQNVCRHTEAAFILIRYQIQSAFYLLLPLNKYIFTVNTVLCHSHSF